MRRARAGRGSSLTLAKAFQFTFVPIFFEKTERGETSVLSIYGTKEDITQLAEDLKTGVALQDIRKDADPKMRLPNVLSSTFDEVEVLVVDEEEMLALRRSARRKKLLIWIVWFLIVIAVLWMLTLK